MLIYGKLITCSGVAQWQSDWLYHNKVDWCAHICMPEKRKYADRAEYLKKAVTDRRRRLKIMIVKYKGDKYAQAFNLYLLLRVRKSLVCLKEGCLDL